MYTITEKIQITASAIRFYARNQGITLDSTTKAHEIWEEKYSREEQMQDPKSHSYKPGFKKTIASEFLMEATDKQAKRVRNLAIK